MAKNYTRKTVNINDLLLDTDNPRFALSLEIGQEPTQDFVIHHLVEHYDISSLAKGILANKDLFGPESITCFEENGKYIVAEGNRRICACKLLLDRNLIPDGKEKKKFPFIDDETSENIQNIEICLYNTKESVQRFLINRHVETGIKKWSTIEKNNYYIRLYSEGYTAKTISSLTGGSEKDVENAIIKYNFFTEVLTSLKTEHFIHTVNIDYLPITERFMGTLVGADEDVGLNLYLDKEELKYISDINKADIYNQILLMIGEAFLIRTSPPNAEERKKYPDDYWKISSEEIRSKPQQIKLIKENKRIVGLYDLIKLYRGITSNNVDSDKDKDASPTDKDSTQPTSKGCTPPTAEGSAQPTAEGSTPPTAKISTPPTAKGASKDNIQPAFIKLFQKTKRVELNSDQLNLLDEIKIAKNSKGELIDYSLIKVKKDGIELTTSILPSLTIETLIKIEFIYIDAVTGLTSAMLMIDGYQPTVNLGASKTAEGLFSLPTKKHYSINYNTTISNLFNQLSTLDITKYKEVIACSIRSMFEISIDSLIKSGKFDHLSLRKTKNSLESDVGTIVGLFENSREFRGVIRNATDIDFDSLGNILKKANFENIISKAHLGAHKSTIYLVENDIKVLIDRMKYFLIIVNEMINNSNIS